LFIYRSMRDSPLPPLALRAPHPLCYVSFFIIITYYSVSLFFPRWGLVCPGGYADLAQGCLWKYRLAHLVVCVFPSHLGAGIWWWCGSPPGFSL
jgi:hypothetical protein